MITCHRRHLEDRCRERGYTLEEVAGCVVSRDGDIWTIDPSHRDYPARAKAKPGTMLKVLLKKFLGIRADPNCRCNGRAVQMDIWGPAVCREKIEEIVGWLKEEARNRGLPFAGFAAKRLVLLAISLSERRGASR